MLHPAGNIIEKLGGARRTAEITGRSFGRVCRWGKPREKGGTGGLIPADVQQDLIAWSRANGNPIGPEDFFPPASATPTKDTAA